MPRRILAAAILVWLLVPGAAVLAQTGTTASLTGRILDDAGDGLPGVVVSLTNPAAPIGSPTSVTDIEGHFAFRLLPPGGGYMLKASIPGFATVIAGPLDLGQGRVTVQNLTLKPAKDLEETIRVEARGDIVDTSSTKTTTTYDSEFIEGLPLLGRKFNDILTLAPGVTDTDGDGNPNVRGARDTGLQLRMDGTNVTDPLTGHFGQDINLETIEEIEIITSGASAEYGRADGGFANIITKSGGNDTQGSVKLFFRSKFLDGDGAGNNDSNPGKPVEVPEFHDLRSFYTLGGAMVRDHLWYFSSIERLDREEPVVFTTGDARLTTLKGWNAFGKITWQANGDNKLALQMSYDPLERGGNFLGSRTTPESDYTIETGGPLLQLKWTSIISPRLLLETLVSRMEGGRAINPVSDHFKTIEVSTESDGRHNYAHLPCITTNCQKDKSIFSLRQDTRGFRFIRTISSIVGPYYYKDDDERERSTFKADLSYAIDDALGSHAIKTGFEFTDERYSDEPINNPQLTDKTLPASRCDNLPPHLPESVRCGTLQMDIFEPVQLPLAADGFNSGAYVQNSWKPRPNLTINLGLRLDNEEINSNGFAPFDPLPESREILRRFDALCEAADLTTGTCSSTRVPGRPFQGLPQEVNLSGVSMSHPSRALDLDGDGLVNLTNSHLEFANYIAPLTTRAARETNGFSISNTNLAPRLSISWDPMADGRTKVFGTWNQYYDRLFLGSVTTEQEPDRFTAQWFAIDATQQADPGSLSKALNGVVSTNQVDRNLATPNTIEWSVGFERELAPEWAVSLTYVSRRGRDLLQDLDMNHITCKQFDGAFHVAPMEVCGDNGRLEMDRFGDTIDPDPNNPVTHPFIRQRNGAIDLYVLNPNWNQVLRTGNFNSSRYASTELALRKRLHRNWQMQLSYTHSVATGQAEKFIDLAGNDPAISDAAVGYLDFDQRHVLKWQAVSHLPHGLILGGTVQWASGLPFSLILIDSDEDDLSNLTGQRISFPTGRKNDQRNSGQWTLNARIEKSFAIRGALASAFLSGENLTDSDDVGITSLRSGVRGSGLDGAKRFGRRWELGVAVEF